MRWVTAILGILLMASCSTSKWCANHCPQSIVRDTIEKVRIDSISVRDTVFKTQADTLFMTDSIDCPDYNKEFGDGKTKVKVVIKNKHIYVEVVNKAQEFRAKLYDHYSKIYEKSSHFEQRAGTVKHKKWLSFWESWVCLGFIFISISRWILKKLKLKLAFQIAPPFITIKKE